LEVFAHRENIKPTFARAPSSRANMTSPDDGPGFAHAARLVPVKSIPVTMAREAVLNATATSRSTNINGRLCVQPSFMTTIIAIDTVVDSCRERFLVPVGAQAAAANKEEKS
jgi:hypothetical protein